MAIFDTMMFLARMVNMVERKRWNGVCDSGSYGMDGQDGREREMVWRL